MAQSFDSALDIKHIIEKYRKASKLKYAKVFQRSVLPPPSDTAHASGLVRWQFGGVSLGLSPLAEYSEVLKCTKVEQSKDVSLDLSPLSDIRPHQLSPPCQPENEHTFIHESKSIISGYKGKTPQRTIFA